MAAVAAVAVEDTVVVVAAAVEAMIVAVVAGKVVEPGMAPLPRRCDYPRIVPRRRHNFVLCLLVRLTSPFLMCVILTQIFTRLLRTSSFAMTALQWMASQTGFLMGSRPS